MWFTEHTGLNLYSIYATLYLGLSVGWPLVQCQLLVSALWAVFYYKEVSSCASATLLVTSSLVVVAGAVMLSYFGIVG
jgi:glucose uptake protein GlcU